VIAELAVAGGVMDDEAARTLEGRIARGTVVRGGGYMRVGEESLDLERGGGGVGSGDGATFSL
jgi:hypothetical protein